MKAGQRRLRMQDAVLRRLSRFDAAHLGPHATALYGEFVSTAVSGLSISTIILAASIVDVVQHEQSGPAGYLDGAAFSYAGSTANLDWLRRRRNHLLHHEGPSDGLMGEGNAETWLVNDAERSVATLLDFLNDLRLSE